MVGIKRDIVDARLKMLGIKCIRCGKYDFFPKEGDFGCVGYCSGSKYVMKDLENEKIMVDIDQKYDNTVSMWVDEEYNKTLKSGVMS